MTDLYMMVLGNCHRDDNNADYTVCEKFNDIASAWRNIENSNDVWQNGACVLSSDDYHVCVKPKDPMHQEVHGNRYLNDIYHRNADGTVKYYLIGCFDSEYKYYVGGGAWTNDESKARLWITDADARKVSDRLDKEDNFVSVAGEVAPFTPAVAHDPHLLEVETLREKSVYIWAIPLGNGLCLWLDSSNRPVTEIEDAYEFATRELAEEDKPPFYTVPNSCVLIKVSRTTSITRVK